MTGCSFHLWTTPFPQPLEELVEELEDEATEEDTDELLSAAELDAVFDPFVEELTASASAPPVPPSPVELEEALVAGLPPPCPVCAGETSDVVLSPRSKPSSFGLLVYDSSSRRSITLPPHETPIDIEDKIKRGIILFFLDGVIIFIVYHSMV